MSIFEKLSGSLGRRVFSPFTVVALAGLSLSAIAQTAPPQLLPYTVSVVAGGGTLGTTYGTPTKPFSIGQACVTGSSYTATDVVGDGCLATQVLLSVPRAAAADSEGNLFIVDSNNQSIRRVDAHTGIISTFAGSVAGTATTTSKGGACPAPSALTATGINGDGCLANQIILYGPEGVAVDAQGNVWFTDYYQGSVREVSKSTGIITTIVNTTNTVGYKADNLVIGTDQKTGITAANGLLYHPYGLTFDNRGNLYIADDYNNLVDVVNLGSTATTIAGLAVPAGEILTIAGSGCPYVSQAVAASEVNASSCDTAAYYGKTPTAGNSVASTSAMLDSPYQVSVDNSGNIYIADEFPYDIRVINGATGMLSTFVNNTFAKESGALARGTALTTTLGSTYGVATDAQGNVYIADYTTTPYVNYIARVDIATGIIYPIAGQLATAVPTLGAAQTGATYCSAKKDAIGDGCPGLQATFWKPYQPFVDAAGNIYVTDQGDNLIRKISVGTQFPPTAVGTPVTQYIDIHYGKGDSNQAPDLLSNSDFAIGTPVCATNSDTTRDCVVSVTFTPTAAGFRNVPLVLQSTSGLVTVVSLTGTGLAPVLALDPGAKSTLASTNLTAVSGIALDFAGNVFATVPGSSSFIGITPSGDESPIGTSFLGANALTLDSSDNVYVALSSGSVLEQPANGGSLTAVGAGFTNPSGIAADSFGNIYIADAGASTVSEIVAGTGAQIVLANKATMQAAGVTFKVPTGIAVDTNGNVFVADVQGNDILEIPFNGSTPLALGFGLSAPTAVAVDPAGSLYVADGGNKRIVFIPNESGTLNTNDQIPIIKTGLSLPSAIAVSANGMVYVADSSNNAIYTFTRSAAAIDLGNAYIALGNEAAVTNTANADIISMGTLPATFGTPFSSVAGTNSSDFALTPTSIPGLPAFPAAGYGLSLTPSFTPGALGYRSATITLDSTAPAAQPTLSLSGTGTQPADSTTTTIASTAPNGQTNWIYGQSVVLNINVAVNAGQPAPTGQVAVYVDGSVTAAGTPQLIPGTTTTPSTATLSISNLSAGPHTFTASYGGDTESDKTDATSCANNGVDCAYPLTLTLNQAPLVVTVNPQQINFDQSLQPFSSSFSGLVNGDSSATIAVDYGTPTYLGPTSPVGQYLITASVSGAALANYSVTVAGNGPANAAGGTLTIVPDASVITVAATAGGQQATSVNPTTQVTLTATVSNFYSQYLPVVVPAGTVTFYNTVSGSTTQIGQPAQVTNGVASITTTFAVVGQTTNNAVTATYTDTVDANFLNSNSNSAPVAIESGVPTIVLTPSTSNSLLTVAPGQSGLMSFTLTPAFGYNGTVSFSCSATSPTINCSFSPSTIVANGTSTSSLVAVTIVTQASSGSQAANRPPTGKTGAGGLPFSLAAVPGLVLLFGFKGMRRRFLNGYSSLLILAVCLIGLGVSACGGSIKIAGTPAGADTVTVVASGTGGSFASVTQQFTVTLNVQQ